jgi:hypothetical protein
MKIAFFWVVIFFSIGPPVCLAQSPLAYNLHNLTNSVEVAGGSPFGYSTRVYADRADYAQQRVSSFYGNSYDYNYHNQNAEQQHQQQHSPSKTVSFFDNRRLNGYHRDMETWRKEEKAKLKGQGRYDRDAIEYVYGIR